MVRDTINKIPTTASETPAVRVASFRILCKLSAAEAGLMDGRLLTKDSWMVLCKSSERNNWDALHGAGIIQVVAPTS